MGEAYRGLTIRIGADTSPLSRGMNNLKSAARAAQKDVRALSSQLKLDPKNQELIARKTAAIGDSARAAASQYSLLKKAADQCSKSYGGMEKMADAIKHSETRAASLRNEYHLVDQSLQSIYDQVVKYNRAQSGDSQKVAEKKLKDLRNAAKGSSASYAELVGQIRAAHAEMEKQGKLPLGAFSLNSLISQYEQLRRRHGEFQSSLSKANQNVGIKNLVNDMRLAESQMRSTRLEYAKLAADERQLGSTGARDAALQMERYGNAIGEASARERMLASAIEGTIGQLAAARSRMQALKDQVSLYNDKMDAAKKRLAQLDGSSVAEMRERFVTTAAAVERFTNELADADSRVDMLAEALRLAKVEARQLARDERFGSEYTEAWNEVRRLSSELDEAKDSARNVRNEFNRANDAHAYMQASREVEMCEANVMRLNAAMRKSSARFTQFGMSVRNMGYTWSATIGAGTQMIGMYAIQAAEDVDSAFRDMRKTVNATEEQYEGLRESALKYSQTHYTSADTLLSIEAIGGQLGIQARNLDSFAATVSNLDIATNLDTDTISQNLGQLSNIMNDMDQNLASGPGSFDSYADALVRLGNNSAAQEDKIQNVMMRIASIGTISGMSTPDLLALATATAATGQGAEAAGTALSKTFTMIEGAVNGVSDDMLEFMSSTDMSDEEMNDYIKDMEKAQAKLDSFASVAGMSSEEFSKMWNATDGSSMNAFKAFIDGLKRIDEEGGSVVNTLKGLDINSVRQLQTLQGLTQTSNILANSMKMSNDAWNGISDIWGDAGDAAREADRKAEGFSGQLQILKNNAQALAADVTNSLTPAVSGLGDIVRDVTTAFSDMPDGMKQVIAMGGILAAAGGPLTIFAGGTIAAAGSVKSFCGSIKDSWAAAQAGGGILDRAGSAIINYGATYTKSTGEVNKFGKAVQKVGLGVGTISAGKLLGAGAIVGATALVASQVIGIYQRWKEHQEQVAESTETTSDRIQRAMASAASSIDEAKNSTISFKDASESHQSLLDKISESNDKMAKAADEAFSKMAHIDYFKGGISDHLKSLEAGAKLTSSQIADLKTKVNGYNEATGEQIQVIENADGSLQVLRNSAALTAEEFDKLAASARASAEASYYSLESADAQHRIIEARTDLEKQRAAAEKRLTELGGDLDLAKRDPKFMEYAKAYEESANIIEKANESLRYSSQMESFAKTDFEGVMGGFQDVINGSDELKYAFSVNNTGILDFMEVLASTNMTAEQFANSAGDIAGWLRTWWKGDIPSAINMLESLGFSFDDVKYRAEQLNGVEIEGKVVRVEDGEIYSAEEHLGNLDEFKIGEKTFTVKPDGVYEGEEQVKAFKEKTELDPLEMKIDLPLQSSDAEMREWINQQWPHIKITADITPSNDPLWQKIMGSSYANMGNYEYNQPDHEARGGFLSLHAAGGLLKNGFFVDKPTYIGSDSRGIAHIAGEAGTEFIQYHADGTTSIIPTQNRKYMEPYVRATAEMLGGMGNTYNVTIYGAPTEAPEQFADDLMRRIRQIERAEGR